MNNKVVLLADRPYQGIYNFDESKVPSYKLPSPLESSSAECKITSPIEWEKQRKKILSLLQKEMFGWMPPRPDILKFQLLSCKEDALENTAIRKEIRIICAMNNGMEKSFDLLLYIPKNTQKPVPVFLGLNGRGNHAATPEKDVRITCEPVVNWDTHEMFATEKPDETTRGVQEEFWNFRNIIKRGYAAATLCISEIFYDSPEAFPESIYKLFIPQKDLQGEMHDFGAIGAWAWGLSRALDCLENEEKVDAQKVILTGHSRLGKTALWAAAYDKRFAMVISNQSGCGGASLSRRIYGETIDYLLFWRSYWFCKNFQKYRNNEEALPFDQHFLLALAAPRILHVSSAENDRHSDPRGEYLATVAAGEVYKLYQCDTSALDGKNMPPLGQNTGNEISYHIRKGDHDITCEDWAIYLDLADKYI